MEGEQVGPHASGLGAQRLALNQGGGGETTQGHEAHEALGGRLLVGHRSPPFPPRQENTGEHSILARTDVCQAERVMHPRHE